MSHTFKTDGFQCKYEGVISDCISVSFPKDSDSAIILMSASQGGQVVLLIDRTALYTLTQKASIALEQK